MADWTARFFTPTDAADIQYGDVRFTIFRQFAGQNYVLAYGNNGLQRRLWVPGDVAPIFNVQQSLARFVLRIPPGTIDLDPGT